MIFFYSVNRAHDQRCGFIRISDMIILIFFMTNIDAKNYKEHLLIKKIGKLSKEKAKNNNGFSKFISIKQDRNAKVTVRKKNTDGSWSKSQSIIEAIDQQDPRVASDTLAHLIQTQDVSELKKHYQVREVAVNHYRIYTISGGGSVKELTVGIFSSEADDEIALHLLLNKIREQI